MTFESLFIVLGRLHTVVLHLPIGFVVALFLLEFYKPNSEASGLARIRDFLLSFAAFFALIAIGTGLTLAEEGGYNADRLNLHKWLGIVFAATLLLARLAVFALKSKPRLLSGAYRGLLLTATGLMFIGGHQGGSLTHGSQYLTEAFQRSERPERRPPPLQPASASTAKEQPGDTAAPATSPASPETSAKTPAPATEIQTAPNAQATGQEEAPSGLANSDEALASEPDSAPSTDLASEPDPSKPHPTSEPAIDFHSQVFPILEDKCFSCHDEDKHKGELRLDSPDWIRKGGEYGEVIVPHDANLSSLYYLTTYPEDDPDFMPQKGEGLTDEEKRILKTWINQGAHFGDGKDKAVPMTFMETESPDSPDVYDETSDESAAKNEHRVTGSDAERIAQLTAKGVLVDTVNNNSNWFEVSLSYMNPINLSALEPLRDRIVKIDLSRSAVQDSDLRALAGFENLQSLNLRKTGISDRGLSELPDLPQLEYLNLHDTRITDAGARELRRFPKLERLYLWGTQVTLQAAQQLNESLPQAEIVLDVSI